MKSSSRSCIGAFDQLILGVNGGIKPLDPKRKRRFLCCGPVPLAKRAEAPERPQHFTGFNRRPGGKGRSTNQLAALIKEMHMLWTILVIVVIVLAVIGLLSVLRGRA